MSDTIGDTMKELFEDHMDRVISELGWKSRTISENDTDGEDFYEISIISPAINLYLHYYDGVLKSLESSNIITAFSSLRGMLESIATIAYFEIHDPDNATYNKFLKSGRIYKKNDRTWREVSKREQIKCINVLADTRNWAKVYDVLCSGVHFSNLHFILTFDDLTLGGDENKDVRLMTKIGIEKMDEETIRFIIEQSEELGEAMRCVLANQFAQKKDNRLKSQRFNYDPHSNSFFPKDFMDYVKESNEEARRLENTATES